MRRSTLGATFALVLAAGAAQAQQDGPFPEASVERARAFWVYNATEATGSEHMDCITTLNHALRLLYDDPYLQLGSQIDRTFAALGRLGLSTPARVIEFNDARGRLTRGVAAPDKLSESAWAALLAMAGNRPGYHVFGLSLMDGYHSVGLVLDQRDLAAPKVYWADQWSSNGGWRQHDQASLDAEIERLTGNWWSSDRKPKTRTTLWRAKPVKRDHWTATSRARMNLRAGPGTDHAVVGAATPGEALQVVGRKGQWLELRRPDGTTVWGMGTLMRTARVARPAPVVTARTPGLTGVLGTN